MSGARVRGWLAAPLVALVVCALPLPAWMVEEFYSRGLFRWSQGRITALSNLAPFALLDLFILCAVGLVLWRAVRLAGLVRDQGVAAALWQGLRRLARAIGIVALVFLLMWGLNYRRVPLAQTLPGQARPSVEDLRGVIADANTLAAWSRPAPGIPTMDEVTRALPAPLNRALAILGRPPLETTGRPKYSAVLTPFFTRAGVDGMVDPLALETIVHPDLLPFERSFTLAHEWAHLAGTADEAEASAIGWLACMNGDPTLAYSASLYLIVESGNALPAGVWRDISRRLDPGVLDDLRAMSRRQARQRPEVQRAAFRVYDRYLRANHVEDGVASYSRALSLILSPRLRDALSSYRGDRGRRP